jgi:DNA polymerase (family 10)
MSKGAGDSKISLILDTTIFEEGFTVGHIDPNVLDAIGGDDYEQLESGGTIDAQVRLVPPGVFPFTLAYFTGSKEHNIAMRQRAIDRGLEVERIWFDTRSQSRRLERHGSSTIFA